MRAWRTHAAPTIGARPGIDGADWAAVDGMANVQGREPQMSGLRRSIGLVYSRAFVRAPC